MFPNWNLQTREIKKFPLFCEHTSYCEYKEYNRKFWTTFAEC